MARDKYSRELKLKIISDHKNGENQISIAKKYNINRSIVSRLIQKFKYTKTVNVDHVGGKPRKTTEHEDEKILRILKENPSVTSKEVVKALKLNVHDSTVRRRVLEIKKQSIRHTGYKKTTDKQYSLLTHEMARFSVEQGTGKNGDSILFWNILTEKLNELGPPYRTVQQWKKVWTDFRRFHTKRNFKSTPKFRRSIKEDHDEDNEILRLGMEGEVEEQNAFQTDNNPDTSSKISHSTHKEWEDFEQNSLSTNSNDFADEYSYSDRHSTQQSHHEHETLIPEESPYDDNNIYTPPSGSKVRPFRDLPNNANHSLLPPLHRPNTRLLDQTLYTLQNQMEHQTKLLEHLSQISSTMAGLMERQVNAVEKQTEAIRRQASATEHHTLVMNNFVDMIREKMPKVNAKTNISNGNL